MTRPTTEPDLVLIGLRGSGKSTLARLLAREKGREWIDLDDRTLERFPDCGTISEVFARHAESAFRAAEFEALAETLAPDPSGRIIALGGGTPTAPGAEQLIEAMRFAGRIVVAYLREQPGTLAQRLAEHGLGDDRPSLTGADPLAEIALLFERRDPLYRSIADRVVEGVRTAPDALDQLRGWGTWRSEG